MNILYELNRKKYLSEITQNLGNVVELDNKIICYVDNEILKKINNETPHILFKGTKNYNQEILNKYNLNKQIYYIIYKMHFKKFLNISTEEDVYLELKHCTFYDSVYIESTGEVFLNGNIYSNSDKKYVLRCYAKNLKIQNETCYNIDYYKPLPRMVTIKLEAENLEIRDCIYLEKFKYGEISFRGATINIKNSQIYYYDTVKIISDNINVDDFSSIDAKKGIIIETITKNGDNNINIDGDTLMLLDAPKIFYNGIEIIEKENYQKNK